MKYIILLSVILIGCAPLSDVKERDLEIERLKSESINQNTKIDEQATLIDSLEIMLEHKSKSADNASAWVDQWFKEFSYCKRELDTLTFKMTELESLIDKEGCQE